MKQSWAEEQRPLHEKVSCNEKLVRNIAKEVGRKQNIDETKRTRTVGIIGVTIFFLHATLLS